MINHGSQHSSHHNSSKLSPKSHVGNNEFHENQPLSLRDRCYPTRTVQPSVISFSPAEGNNFELKHSFIQGVPKFTGSENAYEFLSEFELYASTTKMQQLSNESIKLRLIPFALLESAKRWLNSLPKNSIKSWDNFVTIFLKKFFPFHKTLKIRTEINQFSQNEGETFSKYFERFNQLLYSCPHHAIPKHVLCQIVYEGLNYQTRSQLESMCGGEFMAKTDEEAWEFLEEYSEKDMQWETIRVPIRTPNRGVHAIDPSHLPIDAQTPQEGEGLPHYYTQDQINAIAQNSPYSSTYNPNWKHHPNFSWSNPNNVANPSHMYPMIPNPNYRAPTSNAQNSQPAPQTKPSNQPYRHPNFNPSTQPSQPSQEIARLEKQLSKQNEQITNQDARIEQITKQNEQMLIMMKDLMKINEKGKLPSQTEVNPKYNSRGVNLCENEDVNPVNAVTTLRSGKKVDNNVGNPDILLKSSHVPNSETQSTTTVVNQNDSNSSSKVGNPDHSSPSDVGNPNIPAPLSSPSNITPSSSNEKTSERVYKPIAPFPHRLNKKKKPANFDQILEIFKQVRVNIPLLDTIEQIPQYAKCLKELCTQKRATNVPKTAFLTANTSSVLSNPSPIKYKDPGCPTIGCKIGNTHISHALLDLGASVKLLPYTVYCQLGLGELKPTNITIQLADRSVKKPLGTVEDVLIQIEQFYFPVDFIVLETAPVSNPNSQIPLILGRPFLATSNAIINCRNGQLRLSFGHLTIELNIFNLNKQPRDLEIEEVDMIQTIVENDFSDITESLNMCLDHFNSNLNEDEYIYKLNDMLCSSHNSLEFNQLMSIEA